MLSEIANSPFAIEEPPCISPSWPSLYSSNEAIGDSAPERETIRTHRTMAPNLTRRSHKKSRGGCFSCKSRKIKCQETKPACENCTLREIICSYPNNGTSQPSSRSQHPLVISRRPHSLQSLSSTNDTFTITDMRLFHHFLTMAYPHLPLGNEKVWVNDIPKFAHEHDYLMHAMLALGASHLDRIAPVAENTTTAIIHRGKAMAGLSKALACPEQKYGSEGDAMIATCYALAFQSTYMSDGLIDFITLVRGCALITNKIREEKTFTAFNLQLEWHFDVMESRFQTLPTVHPPFLNDGLRALEEVRQFLVTQTDRQLHAALVTTLKGLQYSSPAGYTGFIGVYALLHDLCDDGFRELMDPNNVMAQLLLSYFISVQFLMVPLSQHEWPPRSDGKRWGILGGAIDQGERIFAAIPATMQPLLWWPTEILATAKAEIANLEPNAPKLLRLNEFAIA